MSETYSIKLVTPGALKRSLTFLIPEIEKQLDCDLDLSLCPALAIADRLNAEQFDLAITGARSAAELEARGTLENVTTIARSGVGVFVRMGDPKPDVSSPDNFVEALAKARVITFSDPKLGGSASNYVSGLIDRLDTDGSLKTKIRLAVEYRSIANIVAAGGVDLALNQVTEILADPRLELVGPLPSEYQRYTDYAIGVVGSSQLRDQARAVIQFLTTPEAIYTMRANGFEPMAPR